MTEIKEANKRIRILRDNQALSRAKFAEKVGLKPKTLENLELGIQEVYNWHLDAIAKNFPKFEYWLHTGKVLPESGQISPELEEKHRDSEKEGKVI